MKMIEVDGETDEVTDLGTVEDVMTRIYCGIFDQDSDPLEEVAEATRAINTWPASGFTFRLYNNRRFAVTVMEIEEADKDS